MIMLTTCRRQTTLSMQTSYFIIQLETNLICSNWTLKCVINQEILCKGFNEIMWLVDPHGPNQHIYFSLTSGNKVFISTSDTFTREHSGSGGKIFLMFWS